MAELFIIAVVIAVVGGAGAMFLEWRLVPVEYRGQRRGRRWVSGALLIVRVGQALIVLGVVSAVLLARLAGDSVSFELSPGSVSLAGNGVVTVRGEAGYMVGICSGEEGPSGYLSTNDLCPKDGKIRQAFGRRSTVDQVIVRKTVRHPGGRVKQLLALSFAAFAALVALLSALAQLLKRAAAGSPFAPESVRSLRVMAGAVVIGGSVVPAIAAVVTRSIIEAQLGEGSVPAVDRGIPIWPWATALMLLALAEVWRYGMRLQEEAEATV